MSRSYPESRRPTSPVGRSRRSVAVGPGRTRDRDWNPLEVMLLVFAVEAVLLYALGIGQGWWGWWPW